ncbi:hypothetical protein JZ751_028210 [Albula glossodonta]|uniref:Glycine zipper domain-containing protein n=1 Tax=Albula glossodonta TaxID=121402 RepID=A0A8T2PJD8_9TELE|nr:hypothetical protein JZ751_028210 [Albula glossodonta]
MEEEERTNTATVSETWRKEEIKMAFSPVLPSDPGMTELLPQNEENGLMQSEEEELRAQSQAEQKEDRGMTVETTGAEEILMNPEGNSFQDLEYRLRQERELRERLEKEKEKRWEEKQREWRDREERQREEMETFRHGNRQDTRGDAEEPQNPRDFLRGENMRALTGVLSGILAMATGKGERHPRRIEQLSQEEEDRQNNRDSGMQREAEELRRREKERKARRDREERQRREMEALRRRYRREAREDAGMSLNAGDVVLGAAIGGIVGSLRGPVGAAVGAGIGAVVGARLEDLLREGDIYGVNIREGFFLPVMRLMHLEMRRDRPLEWTELPPEEEEDPQNNRNRQMQGEEEMLRAQHWAEQKETEKRMREETRRQLENSIKPLELKINNLEDELGRERDEHKRRQLEEELKKEREQRESLEREKERRREEERKERREREERQSEEMEALRQRYRREAREDAGISLTGGAVVLGAAIGGIAGALRGPMGAVVGTALGAALGARLSPLLEWER